MKTISSNMGLLGKTCIMCLLEKSNKPDFYLSSSGLIILVNNNFNTADGTPREVPRLEVKFLDRVLAPYIEKGIVKRVEIGDGYGHSRRFAYQIPLDKIEEAKKLI